MSNQCSICGNEFVRQTGRGRNPKKQKSEYQETCSYDCMLIAKQKNYISTKSQGGKEE